MVILWSRAVCGHLSHVALISLKYCIRHSGEFSICWECLQRSNFEILIFFVTARIDTQITNNLILVKHLFQCIRMEDAPAFNENMKQLFQWNVTKKRNKSIKFTLFDVWFTVSRMIIEFAFQFKTVISYCVPLRFWNWRNLRTTLCLLEPSRLVLW